MTLDLFKPTKLGAIEMNNHMVMAPLTRGRAGADAMPNDLMTEYYAQRASAGLIITEATAISRQGYGWFKAPGIYTDEMQAAWKNITKAVHDKGGKIVCQLWHMGRVSHPDFNDGKAPVAPSAIKAEGEVRVPPNGEKKPYVTPHALEIDELSGIIADYVRAARRAIDAGFDGVEVHAANGYLLDQFLRDGANKRDDNYGGSAENRCRFVIEVLKAVCDEIGADRTGVRISPQNPFNSMSDSDPKDTFTTFAKLIAPLNLAYLHIMEPVNKDHPFAHGEYITPHIHDVYNGPVMVNGAYDMQSGELVLENHQADAVAFGVPFIANPDLVERFRLGADLNEPRQEFFYTDGAEGYTDYPFLEHNEKQQAAS